jgi:hypothetical protein
MTSTPMERKNRGLELTAEEAHRLLTLCLTSPGRLDAVGEAALKKLACYCKEHDSHPVLVSESDCTLS